MFISVSYTHLSLVGKLTYKNFSVLFTGDIEKEAERLLLGKSINADIIKIPHHLSLIHIFPGFSIRGFWTAVIAALIISAIDYLIERIFNFDASPFGRGLSGFIVSDVYKRQGK